MFRPEVAAAREGSQFGAIRVMAPVSIRLLTIAAVIVGVTVVLWMYFGSYTRRERVEGVLALNASPAQINAPSTGELSELLVHEGQQVKPGDLIAVLRGAPSRQELVREWQKIADKLQQIRSQVQAQPETKAALLALTQVLTQIETAIAADGVAQFPMKASVGGTVAGITASLGQHLSRGTTLASVIPSGNKLQAHLFVQSSAIGLLQPGDEVALLYDAFPFQKFGAFRGRVLTIADVPTSANAIEALRGTARNNVKLYLVTVSLPSQSIHYDERQINLKPGMTVRADLMLESRRIYQWLFEPLRSLNYRMDEQP